LNIFMPFGIRNIIMSFNIKYFKSAAELVARINAYFTSVGIEYTLEPRPSKNPKYNANRAADEIKVTPTKPAGDKYDPPTIAGLALFLGFDSLLDFSTYEARGKYPHYLKRARLLITASYEKKLHNTNASGAIFALKGMGWSEQSESKPAAPVNNILNINMVESGPKPAATEKDIPI